MKKLCVLLSFLVPLTIVAQKRVDLDRYHFTVQYRSLPAIPLDSSFRTYNVQVESTKMMSSFLKDISPQNSVILEGWKKLSADGHITIKVKMEDLLPESFSVKERLETTKNSLGQVTGTRILYHQEVVYTFAAVATINDYKGLHIMDESLADRAYKQVYSGPEFPIKAIAEGYFGLNALTVTGNLFQNCVNRAMHFLSDNITANFGFREVSVRDFVWVVGSKKHPEYSDNRRAIQQMSDALFTMTADSQGANIRKQLEPVIQYFEKIKRDYNSSSRHDRKIRYASYYNLAVLYYYLDDPQLMMKEANGLVLNDFDTNDGKAFEQSATGLKNLFKNSNINTRHFSINTSSFRGPFEGNAAVIAK